MPLVRYTQGYLFTPAAKTLDVSRFYPTFDFTRVKQIRQDNSGVLLYAPGNGSAAATFSNGIITFTSVDTTKYSSRDPISILYDEPDNNSPFASAVAVPANTTVTPGRAVWINCTTAGTVTFTLPDNSTITVPVAVGLATFPIAMTKYVFTTAVGTVYNMT